MKKTGILRLLDKSDIDAFWERVKTGKKDDCWSWVGATTSGGQPLFVRRGGKIQLQARRVCWAITHQEEPARPIRTSCGNVDCVNPNHLEMKEIDASFDSWLNMTGMSRKQASDALGVSEETIDGYQEGKQKPRYSILVLMQLIADGEDPTPWPRAA
jgi:hypothetical protein